MKHAAIVLLILLTLPLATAETIKVSSLSLDGTIEDETLRFALTFDAVASVADAEIPLLSADSVLAELPTGDGWRVRFDPQRDMYLLHIDEPNVAASIETVFVTRSKIYDEDPTWRQVSIVIPDAQVRTIKVAVNDPELALELPGALQQDTVTTDTSLTATGVLPPHVPCRIRWKTSVEIVEEAELILASEANSMYTVSFGTLRTDGLYTYRITQGKLRELTFEVPKTLSITQVRGADIRDWQLQQGDAINTLSVQLSREQTQIYGLQILAESVVPQLPTDLDLPVITPLEGSRSDGFVTVGTRSAIQLVVKDSSGVSQIDGSAFPRIVLSKEQPRQLPGSKAFFYSFSSTPYQLAISLADIVSSFDVDQRLVVSVKDDDMLTALQTELDVRDAPIRRLETIIPGAFVVANVTGNAVDDYAVIENDDGTKTLAVEFKAPILGKTTFDASLELGRSPIGAAHTISGFNVPGSRTTRGFIAVVTDQGVQITDPEIEGLRRVHTRSLKMRVPGAEFAWRFRETGWTLTMGVAEKPPAIRAEAFHLISLGEGMAYGSLALTYFISGAPVDELKFRVAPELHAVEFTGLDVSSRTQEGDIITVKLRRKVIEDYNLGVTYSQRILDDSPQFLAGGVSCAGVETQTGFIAIASHRNLNVEGQDADPALIRIGVDEIPSQYRLLVTAPILSSYKYVGTPHQTTLLIKPFRQGAMLPMIVEFVKAVTTLSITDNQETESVTIVSYTLKNSTAQFLDLRIPTNINIWSTTIVNGNDRKKVPAATHENVLKIPLQRSHNPNQPIKLELEYGQVHGKLDWEGEIELQLPPSLVHSTFADWTIRSPDTWSLATVDEGTMGLTSAHIKPVGMLDCVQVAGKTLQRNYAKLFWLFAVAGILLIVAVIIRHKVVGRIAITALVVASIIAGAATTDRTLSRTRQRPVRELKFEQVLHVDASQPLSISARVTPDWRQHFDKFTAMVAGIIALLAFAGSLMKFPALLRRILAACGVTALLVIGAQSTPGLQVIVHALTWAAPTLIGLWLLIRMVRPRRSSLPSTGTAALAGLALMVFVGNSTVADEVQVVAVPPHAVVIDEVECKLTASGDSMETELIFTVDTKALIRVPIGPDDVAILEGPAADSVVSLVSINGQHTLSFPGGKHQARVRLLLPLAAGNDSEQASFSLALPHALRNLVTLQVPRSGLRIEAPHAVQLKIDEGTDVTNATAVMRAGRPATFTWQPKVRSRGEEKTAFYTDAASLAVVDNGVVECTHRFLFRVSQGEMKRVGVAIPANMTVNQVHGENLATWRFNPEEDRLDVRFSQPVKGDYPLIVVTQIAANAVPYEASIKPLMVEATERQRGSLGLVSTDRVLMTIKTHPRPMNIGDYTRGAKPLLGNRAEVPYAYRFSEPTAEITVNVSAVLPELRTIEQASFSVGDERLAYSGAIVIEVSKAGRFDVDLELPEGYDIDTLSGTDVSHWDETSDDGRRVRVHFKKKLQGRTQLTIGLSQSLTSLPERLIVPRIAIADSLKHQGQLVVIASRGVRLSVAERNGISELDPAQLQMSSKPALAFKLLRPDWHLVLGREVLLPRVNVDFLHLAKISDGLVRHVHYLRHKLHNAGTKTFEIQLPKQVLGLLITGPEIARRKQIDPEKNIWQIELTGKWYDKPYPLQVTYETRFDPATGAVQIEPVHSVGAELQQGFVVVRSSSRVELSETSAELPLQSAEARSVPVEYGAGDLSDAAFCYRSSSSDYTLKFAGARHAAADLLEAEVLETRISTVINRQGQGIHRLNMQLRTGAKRYLLATLPKGAEVWSLLVDRQSRRPSLTPTDQLLIPLPQDTGSAAEVAIELIYVAAGQAGVRNEHTGPKFDLPLRNISWELYLPDGREYEDFAGTLSVEKQSIEAPTVQRYDIDSYMGELEATRTNDLSIARQRQQEGLDLARRGDQKAAVHALNQAYNYSQTDRALNEDARVVLNNLRNTQAMIGLVQRRVANKKRDQNGVEVAWDAQFTQQQAEQLQSSLNKADSDNIGQITSKMIEIQDTAAATNLQLMINMPIRGQQVTYHRALQVEPNAAMFVSYAAVMPAADDYPWMWIVVAGAILILVFTLLPLLANGWDALHVSAANARRTRRVAADALKTAAASRAMTETKEFPAEVKVEDVSIDADTIAADSAADVAIDDDSDDCDPSTGSVIDQEEAPADDDPPVSESLFDEDSPPESSVESDQLPEPDVDEPSTDSGEIQDDEDSDNDKEDRPNA